MSFINNNTWSGLFSFGENDKELIYTVLGIDVAKKRITPEDIINESNNYYYTKLNTLKQKIDMALDSDNKKLFMKLSKEYKMLLD